MSDYGPSKLEGAVEGEEPLEESSLLPDRKINEQSEAHVRKLLSPLSRDQLINIFVKLSIQYEPVLHEIKHASETDPSRTKLFVRELAWATTSEKLRSVFEKYGEIEEAVVIKDRHTQRSRGFGFVRFKVAAAAARALQEPAKEIDGRMTQCNLASAGNPFKRNSTSTTAAVAPRLESPTNPFWGYPSSRSWAPQESWQSDPLRWNSSRFATSRPPPYGSPATYTTPYPTASHTSPRRYEATSAPSTSVPPTAYTSYTKPYSPQSIVQGYSLPTTVGTVSSTQPASATTSRTSPTHTTHLPLQQTQFAYGQSYASYTPTHQ